MRWFTTVAAAAAIAMSVAAPAVAQSNWNTPTEPFHVIDNVYYVGTEGLSAFLFTTPEGHILLDGATPEGIVTALAALKRGVRGMRRERRDLRCGRAAPVERFTEDVAELVTPVLAHRLGLARQTSDALEERRAVGAVLKRILAAIPTPT